MVIICANKRVAQQVQAVLLGAGVSRRLLTKGGPYLNSAKVQIRIGDDKVSAELRRRIASMAGVEIRDETSEASVSEESPEKPADEGGGGSSDWKRPGWPGDEDR
jgi:hypothetical protein